MSKMQTDKYIPLEETDEPNEIKSDGKYSEQKSGCIHPHDNIKIIKEYSYEEHPSDLLTIKYAKINCRLCECIFLANRQVVDIFGTKQSFEFSAVPCIDQNHCKHNDFDVDEKQAFTEHASSETIPRIFGSSVKTIKWKQGSGQCIFCNKMVSVCMYYEGKRKHEMKHWFLKE
jgi:hypothetical protein